MTTAEPPGDVESVVRRYYSVVSDLTSTASDLRFLLDDKVRIVEHPNLVTPRGAVRDLDATLAGFQAGKALLRQQAFDVDEVLVDGARAAVRATWRATVDIDAGPFHAGQQLTAHVAAMLTVKDSRVVDHETFDCYEPFSPTSKPSEATA